MVGTSVYATFYIPQKIAEGLANGTLERIGGVVREVGSKRIVAWLREIPDASNKIQKIIHINTAISVLTLGTTVAGFAVIHQRLDSIEACLKDMQETLNEIDQKLDLSFYAQFRAALDMAAKAFKMSDTKNRKPLAFQVIQSFAQSEHIYTKYLDQELQLQGRAVHEYLSMLALIYLTETRCYLELGEYLSAMERLKEGYSRLQNYTRLYIEMLLTSNPAAYISPFLKTEISLSRLTQIYRWLDPGMGESDVFEKLRSNLFQWHADASVLTGFRWLKELPPAILIKADFEKKGYFHRSGQVEQALACLPKVMEKMESAIETCNRLKGYQTEVQAMENFGISFQEWLSLQPKEEQPENAQMVYILAA
ncbi:hypothetical protein IQ254_21405 [Nodosilinea sp. LEGE 07088]|uniref:hypothetical protein n=1 Tax=Nodosilinea sp. LEGE 07088 TaxID=2777968 RepID=UPI001881245D|nr:hypothetical protein [Nodosilinea sp. LEGE 07088]MBE9139722.1 hypothetical protein [Nodosilinea sp. LEGE 07088]